MKRIYYIIAGILIFAVSCNTDIEQIRIKEGTPPQIIATPGNDSEIIFDKEKPEEMALSIEWTDPQYLDQETQGNVIGKYIVQLAVSGNFTDSYEKLLGNVNELSFTTEELNQILLKLDDVIPGSSYDLFLKVTSVFFDTDSLESSEVFSFLVKPYSITIPPAIEVPEEVWITGGALTTGWNQPFLPEQQFTKESETSFSITIDIIGGGEYEMITDGNGTNWTPVYRIDPALNPADMIWDGTFVWDGEGSDYAWQSLKFQAPPTDGTYKITLNFQDATFEVIDLKGPPAIVVPDEVWITGSALSVGWDKPFLPEQQLTKESETKFSITTALIGGEDYAMITDGNGDNWTPVYRIDPGLDPVDMVWGGTFVWDGEGSDYGWSSLSFMSPPDNGAYKITLDFQTAKFTVEDLN